MKKLSLLGFVGLLASVLAGCPIYSSGDGGTGCGDYSNCSTGNGPGGCFSPSDCGQNETCGSDNQCHPGDCTTPSTGCLPGYTCAIDPTSETASCVPGNGTGGAGTGGAGGAGTGGKGTGGKGAGTGGMTSSTGTSMSSSSGTGGSTMTPVYCGHPSDCPASEICGSAGTCVPGPCSAGNACIFGYTCGADGTCQGGPNACDTSASCTGGAVCIAGPSTNGGVCTQPSNQCFDQSQCDTGDKCVAGQCTPGCSTSADCRDGYSCNTTLGTCSTPKKVCSVTSDCGNATTVCVGGACVPRSPNGTCGLGDVWDENGCIPNQAASFTCNADGVQDACAQGSICLHHDCWISCDAPNQTACSSQPTLDVCKPVDSGSATYNVCGTNQNLGNECGAGAMNLTCSGGKICIDGSCK